MHFSKCSRGFRALRFGIVMQRPVARFPIVDASAFELGQHIEHRATGGSDEGRPLQQFAARELTSFPHVPRRIHNEMTTIHPADKH